MVGKRQVRALLQHQEWWLAAPATLGPGLLVPEAAPLCSLGAAAVLTRVSTFLFTGDTGILGRLQAMYLAKCFSGVLGPSHGKVCSQQTIVPVSYLTLLRVLNPVTQPVIFFNWFQPCLGHTVAYPTSGAIR